MEGYSDGGSVRHVLDFMIFSCSKGEERIDRVELLCNDVTDVSSSGKECFTPIHNTSVHLKIKIYVNLYSSPNTLVSINQI